MYIPLAIKTDYSLLNSLIKIPDLINYLKDHNINTCGILDDNLYSSIPFFTSCQKNNIKPIIGLKIKINDQKIFLYAKNYAGFKNLLKLNTILNRQDITIVDLKSYKKDIICVIPFAAKELYEELKNTYENLFISYNDEYEKNNASLITDNIVFLNETCAFSFKDIRYIPLLREIDTGTKVPLSVYTDSYLEREVNSFDIETTKNFANQIDIQITTNQKYIPHYDDAIADSYSFLKNLCIKGLSKRLHGNIPAPYKERLQMELEVIRKMDFVDYFLIVYDYVKYAKNHDILVGPGRGSAAGSLVSYSIGITNIDPLKYNLLFERFLNPERITMPDIDIDFEYTKRDQVVKYVKSRYGEEKVANIITFGTLGARQVIRDVGKCLNIDTSLIDHLSNLLDPKQTLKENLQNKLVSDFISYNSNIKNLYQICFKLEGLKRHISTHAAGVVISSIPLDDVIPICYSGDDLLTGVTMEYLEDLGLLKMDFLALRNLTIIKNVLELIENETGQKINLSEIPLDDKDTMNIFKTVDTEGVFQYESSGMKNLTSKLKPDNFNDLVAEVALFRPGPMDNIDTFIKRKHGQEPIVYPDESLKYILSDTYGIMIYQEQIMQVLVKMGNYTFAEADNIRRAMSKKKVEVMEQERKTFIARSVKNNYTQERAEEVYNLIIKFANYGFNKAHSVSYALIGYQMAYLKANYPVYFIANLLNMSIGSDIKTKEYIDEAKRKNILIFKPNINISKEEYIIKKNALLLPLNCIHSLGSSAASEIIKERTENGRFTDFFNFVARTYGKSINRKTIEYLIDADCFRDFQLNHQTLYFNIDISIDYATLCTDLDESLVIKPDIIEKEEYDEANLMEKELQTFGYFVTNHPSSKYQQGIMKIKDIKNFFDKYIDCVVIINSIRKIKTKKGEDMGFILASDETDNCDFIIFPKNNKYLSTIKKNELVKIHGQVTKRIDKYQIIISNIEKIN